MYSKLQTNCELVLYDVVVNINHYNVKINNKKSKIHII